MHFMIAIVVYVDDISENGEVISFPLLKYHLETKALLKIFVTSQIFSEYLLIKYTFVTVKKRHVPFCTFFMPYF